MIFDRGAVFSAAVTATLRSLQVKPTRTSYRSPWQNGVAERVVATVRRELLDHVIVVDSASAVVGVPRVGGLHHRHAWRQAA